MMANDPKLTAAEVDDARRRRISGMGLQVIEGNPLTADEVEMFEMFERERWSHERCRRYILEGIKQSAPIAAE